MYNDLLIDNNRRDPNPAQVTSLEGWAELLYYAQDGQSPPIWIFFTSSILLFTFFTLKLFCAVMFLTFSRVRVAYETGKVLHEDGPGLYANARALERKEVPATENSVLQCNTAGVV